jgi:Tfp pilus assembly protein PilP
MSKGRLTIIACCLAIAAPSVMLSACDSKPKAKRSPRKKGSRRRPPPRARRPPPRRPAPKKLVLPKLELSDDDFVEAATNRDPFRAYLTEDRSRPGRIESDVKKLAKLGKYALDELRLIAVVTGPEVRAMAMFRDPAGLGVAIRRGDYISKSAARVKTILPGQVVVEIKEQYEGGLKIADRVIQLHAKKGRRL